MQPATPDRGRSGAARWAGPSRRARLLTIALSIALAALTFAIVSRAWRRAAPPPPAPPTSVEVKVIAAPAPALAPR